MNSGGVRWIQIMTEPEPVRSPEGIVYSCNPHRAIGLDNQAYFLKGGAHAMVVFAEAAGYTLAREVGLPTPSFGLWRDPRSHELFFASTEVPIRSGIVELMRGNETDCREFLGQCIAFDVWIRNPDRNTYNVLVEPSSSQSAVSAVKIYAIDFEKSRVLRGESPLTITNDRPRDYFPRDELGSACAGLSVPIAGFERIQRLDQANLYAILESLAADMEWPTMPDLDRIANHLASRAGQMPRLLREVWNDRHI